MNANEYVQAILNSYHLCFIDKFVDKQPFYSDVAP